MAVEKSAVVEVEFADSIFQGLPQWSFPGDVKLIVFTAISDQQCESFE